MNFRSLTVSITAFGLLQACGKQDERQADKTSPLTANEVMESSEIQSQLLSENSIETTDQISDLSESSASFGLEGSSTIRDLVKERTRTCTEAQDSNSVTVNIARSFTNTKSTTRISKEVSLSDEITRVWSHPSIDLKCKDLHLDFDLIAGSELGLKKEVTFSKERSMSIETAKRTLSRSMSKAGTKTAEFTANIGADDPNGYSLHSLKVNSTSTKSLKISKNGKDRSMSIKNTLVDLLVDVNRGKSGWDYKLIHSGSLSSSVEGGVEMKLDYNKVKFVKSEEKDSCRPVAGSIKGSIKGPSSTKDFTVEFSESETVITVDGKVSTDLEMDFSGCDFGKVE